MITFDEFTENVIFCCIIRGFNEDFCLNGNQKIRILEANITMQNYNSVLTILWEC